MELGIIVPSDGFFVALPLELVQKIQVAVSDVFRSRNYRKCCDLARPMW